MCTYYIHFLLTGMFVVLCVVLFFGSTMAAVAMKSIHNISISSTMSQLLYTHTVAKHNRQ